MKKTKKIKITKILAAIFLMLGLICSSIPVSATSNKILVTDTDNNNSISLGDEFCLGEECFYITKNEEGMIHALAKYNLYAGYTLIKADDELIAELDSDYNGTIRRRGYFDCPYISKYDFTYCMAPIDYSLTDNTEMLGLHSRDEINNNCFRYEYNDTEYIDGITYHNVTSCVSIQYNHSPLRQSSQAISKHGGSSATGPEYPEIGDYFFGANTSIYDGEYVDELIINYNTENELTSDNFIYKYLNDYKTTLNTLGKGNISSVDLLTYNDLAGILTSINPDGKEFKRNGYLCEGDWVDNGDGSWSCSNADYPYEWTIEEENMFAYVGRAGIKQYIPEQYNWLYSTTYWLGTAFYNSINEVEYETTNNYQFFLDTLGDLCYVDRHAGCMWDEIGAGIRPVISVTADQFELNRMDINGTVRWIDNNDESRIRPLKSIIKLYRNNELIDSIEVEKDIEEDLWRFSFLNLLKYDANGVEYAYSITQDDIPQYASDITNFDVVNQYAPDMVVPNTGANQHASDATNSNTGLTYIFITSIICFGIFLLLHRSKKITFADNN